MLLSAIDKDLLDKLEIAKGFLDQIKLYINPEIYKEEMNLSDPDSDYTKKNALFEQQSMMGRETGKMESPKIMKDAIAKFYDKKSDDVEYIDLSGKTHRFVKREEPEDEDVLG